MSRKSRNAALKAALVALILSLSLAAPVAAGPFEDGVAAHGRGDNATALKLWRPLADQGDVEAQYNLGVMYDTGQGVPENYAEAVKWYRKAAEQGNAGAQFSLGFMYFEGQGVPQDYVQAHKWFNLSATRAAADEDFMRAMFPALAVKTMAVNYRDLVAAKMTPAQIAEAQKLASEWKPSKSGKLFSRLMEDFRRFLLNLN